MTSTLDMRSRILWPRLDDLNVYGEETVYDVNPDLGAASNLGSKKARYFWIGRGYADTIAMGCKIAFSPDKQGAAASTDNSSLTLVSWAGRLTGLGQACPFHASVTATKLQMWCRTTTDGQLKSTGVFDFHGAVNLKDGQLHDIAVARRGSTVAFFVDSQVHTWHNTNDDYAAAPGMYPCWEPYTFADTDRRVWFAKPWCVVTTEWNFDRLPYGSASVPGLEEAWREAGQ